VQKPATKKLSSNILNGNEQTTIHIGDTTPKVESVLPHSLFLSFVLIIFGVLYVLSFSLSILF
jgi:hypothetical protein